MNVKTRNCDFGNANCDTSKFYKHTLINHASNKGQLTKHETMCMHTDESNHAQLRGVITTTNDTTNDTTTIDYSRDQMKVFDICINKLIKLSIIDNGGIDDKKYTHIIKRYHGDKLISEIIIKINN